jgi:alpha,alpha-trehalose-phosphate synthase [UDP-forming]
MISAARLLVVSNRLPVTIDMAQNGLRLKPSGGGLVSALLPVLQENGGCWVGWTGSSTQSGVTDLLRRWCSTEKYSLKPVFLTDLEQTYFYDGCSNEILWPLCHGFTLRCKFSPAYWGCYCNANEKFADAVQRAWQPGDFVWIHDYHLMMLAHALRARGAQYPLAYFHHIPFPPPEVLEALPWRVELLRSLMSFTTIGFQTRRDVRNFIDCAYRFLSDVHVNRAGESLSLSCGKRSARVGHYPISIDYKAFAAEAAEPAVLIAAKCIQERFSGTRIILGVDRLDYTKGIPERLAAFQTLLECNPDLLGRVTMLQVVIPSRETIPDYRRLQLRIEALVNKINREYGRPGWVPIDYRYGSLERSELLALYRAADVALVTPLRDGMNLVAKEFCASRVDDSGVLVLSKLAGAAEELNGGALLVDPHDVESIADVLMRALQMDKRQQRLRMESMRACIHEHDVFRWSSLFCANAGVRVLAAIPGRWNSFGVRAVGD